MRSWGVQDDVSETQWGFLSIPKLQRDPLSNQWVPLLIPIVAESFGQYRSSHISVWHPRAKRPAKELPIVSETCTVLDVVGDLAVSSRHGEDAAPA